MIETYRGIVYPGQLDHMGHMNVQWYTSKFDEGTWHLFSLVGITSNYIRQNNRGMAALEQTTKYKSEVMAGDLLVVKSNILEVKDKVIRFIHVMYNSESGVEVATTELIAAHIDRLIRKACPFPEAIKLNCLAIIKNTTIQPNADKPSN